MLLKDDRERAIAYAVYKTLERVLKEEPNIDPGKIDVAGETLTITLPPGSLVSRGEGANGDGIVPKKAVQNLYGYALWALFIQRLQKFNQWAAVERHLRDALNEFVKRSSKPKFGEKDPSVKDELCKELPEIVEIIENLQSNLEIPMRDEETPRNFKDPKLPPTLVFTGKK